MRGTKEMLDIMDAFERACKSPYSGYMPAKAERTEQNGRIVDGGSKTDFYTNGHINQMFKLFMMGWQAGKSQQS